MRNHTLLDQAFEATTLGILEQLLHHGMGIILSLDPASNIGAISP